MRSRRGGAAATGSTTVSRPRSYVARRRRGRRSRAARCGARRGRTRSRAGGRRGRQSGMRPVPLAGDHERALVDDDVHVARVDAGEVDDHAQLGRILRADDVDRRPEAAARDGEARAVPELVEEAFELAAGALVVATGHRDSVPSAWRRATPASASGAERGEIHPVHGLEHLAAHPRREEATGDAVAEGGDRRLVTRHARVQGAVGRRNARGPLSFAASPTSRWYIGSSKGGRPPAPSR